MGVSVSTIFGVNLGFEFLTKDVAEQMDEAASWGILVDLFILRVIFVF